MKDLEEESTDKHYKKHKIDTSEFNLDAILRNSDKFVEKYMGKTSVKHNENERRCFRKEAGYISR